ncbi:MAG: HD domain-containing protein [Armatimonadetes bacterium]|nr:HD domain-containing protein [Armatimonadota bacterium]
MTTLPRQAREQPPVVAQSVERIEQAKEFLRLLMAAIKDLRLYPKGHPRVDEATDLVETAIRDILAPAPDIRFDVWEDAVFVNKELVEEDSVYLRQFSGLCLERKIGSVSFRRGIDRAELVEVVQILGLEPEEIIALGGAPDALKEAGVRHVRIGPPRVWQAPASGSVERAAEQVYYWAVQTFVEMTFEVERYGQLDILRARFVVESLQEMLLRGAREITRLAAMGGHDEESARHPVNVCLLTLLAVFGVELDARQRSNLGLAALVHDIGKVNIPADLRYKVDPLAPGEEAIRQRHVVEGAYLLRSLSGWDSIPMAAAFEHHARFDLSGYPKLSFKERPHPYSRLVAIADFYDTTTASRDRVRRVLRPEQAMVVIQGLSGTWFDPPMAALFTHALGPYPMGSVVELDSGDVAVVYQANLAEPTRPWVKVVRDRQGQALEPTSLDLARSPTHRIVRGVDPGRYGIDVAMHL